MGDADERYRGYRAAQLRTLIESGQWPHNLMHEALAWLDAREAADQAQTAQAAAAANKRERIAAIAAIVAAVAAIIGLVISVLAWLFPHTR